VAKKIGALIDADILDVAKNPIDAIADSEILILGVSTWGFGDLQDDRESFLPNLEAADLKGKTIAI